MRWVISLGIALLFLSCNGGAPRRVHKLESKELMKGSTIQNIDSAEHTVLQFVIDNKVNYATINQYFRDYKEKAHFPLSLWVTVETLNKNETGHPIDDEAVLFNSLEDSLISHIAASMPFCYIGRTTRDGYREIMFYVTEKQGAVDVMNKFIKQNPFNREVEFAIDDDPTWESVSGLY
jgi:hypothetical protein